MSTTPFFLERVKHYPTAKIGLLLAVSPVLSAMIAPIAGALPDRLGTGLIEVEQGSIGCTARKNFLPNAF